MRDSRPIAVDGRFVGVAVARDAAWLFLATDPAFAELQGQPFPDPGEAERVARLFLTRGAAGRPI